MEGQEQDKSNLERVVRNYIVWDDASRFLKAEGLPANEEQFAKTFVENKDFLRTIFNKLNEIENNNLYAEYGLFFLEQYTGTKEKAIEHALIGINSNPCEYHTYLLRTTLAEYYESLGMLRESNVQYMNNIDYMLSQMRTYIDNFFKTESTKIALAGSVSIKLLEDEKKTPLNTIIISESLPEFAKATQNKEDREEYLKAIELHRSGSYAQANPILEVLNDKFTYYDEDLVDGIESLVANVSLAFQLNMKKHIELVRN